MARDKNPGQHHLILMTGQWVSLFFFIYIFFLYVLFTFYLWSIDLIHLVLEQTCFIQLAMASWVSLSRDWICWMNVTFLSLCRHRRSKWCQVSVCVTQSEREKVIKAHLYGVGVWLHQQGLIHVRLTLIRVKQFCKANFIYQNFKFKQSSTTTSISNLQALLKLNLLHWLFKLNLRSQFNSLNV